jgi:hypothetical protein
VKDENRVATATITTSSMAKTTRASAWPMSRGAPLAHETITKAIDMKTSWSQTVSTSPRNFPIRNSPRDTGFERIV